MNKTTARARTGWRRALLRCRAMGAAATLLVLSACSTMPGWIPADGPSREQVQGLANVEVASGVHLIKVHDGLARRLADAKKLDQFNHVFSTTADNHYLIGPGDIVEVAVWETPPAMLFGSIELNPTSGPVTTHAITLPPQMVTADGTISIPFAGYIPVQGRTTQEIEREITRRLQGKAHLPQVLVRVVQNNTSNVTVVGDVAQSTLMPLTPKGERLLDALARSGGVTQPVNRVAIQLTRHNTTATMALDAIIRDPQQNIVLQPGDVLTALHQPQSFTVLGATGKNEEITFEAQGISLAQALARAGGLDDRRADARGVFVFRFEDPGLVLDTGTRTLDDSAHHIKMDEEGRIPVVYEVDLRDAASLFVARHFPMQDQDLVYVANSPAAELTKFLNMIGAVVSPGLTIQRATQ